ncbi:MAG: hypothetical protein K9G30_09795 [Parvibaculum sp.]|nr:hypothetical protein [Parvibaculum sp.]
MNGAAGTGGGMPVVSRRGLLQLGLAGTAIVWGGGLIGCAVSAAEAPAARRAALSPQGEKILRAIAPVILGTLLPADGVARTQALDESMAAIDDYLCHLSLPVQEEARRAFGLLDLLPVRMALLGTASRWRDAEPADIEAFLRSARASRITLLRRIHALLQSMIVLAWFDLPRAWEEIGYPGPPIPRPLPTLE